MQRYACNDQAFSILTPEACYWAGVLAADGCVRTRALSSHVVVLKMDDLELIEKFRSFTRSEATIHSGVRFNGKTWYSIQISSDRMFADLCGLGIVPNKSLVLSVSARLANSRDFWRGVLDGDGGVYVSSGYFRLMICSGSWLFINQLKQFFETLGVRRKITCDARKLNPLYSIQLSGDQARRVAKELYFDCCMALDRKLTVAEKALEFVDRRKTRVDGVTAKEVLGHGE